MHESQAVLAQESDCTEDDLVTSQCDELLGRLTAGVAHYFNNLMTTVLGFSELLLQERFQDDPARGGLEEIHRAGQQISAITAQLLAVARRQRYQPTRLALNELVTDVAALGRSILGSGVQLTAALTPTMPLVWADRARLRQILLTLLLNARDATPRGGCLRLATADLVVDEELATVQPAVPPGHYVSVLVSGGGQGTAPPLATCFTSQELGDDGWGLPLVRRLLRRERGHLAVTNREGRGVAYAILLPVAEV